VANGSVNPPVPGWIGIAAQITTQVGVPTVVAGVLLWFVLFRVDGAMKVIQEQEQTRTEMVQKMQDALIAALDREGTAFNSAVDRNIQTNRENAERFERMVRELESRTQKP
jgi:uncharacterized protein HemX